jgi:hypothetical protein
MLKRYRIFAAFVLFALPWAGRSQTGNSLNTFSPYTFYGIGDIHQVGTTSVRSMGGAGIASWSPFEVNLRNPAAYGNARPQSAVLTFGLSGISNYLKTDRTKTAKNTFSFNDLALMLPLARNVGFSFSVSPYSSVGYSTSYEETNPDILNEVGHVLYNFNGEGNISLAKAGIGARLFKNFSVGADFTAYLGTITRSATTQISSATTDSYQNVMQIVSEQVADVSFDAGIQYDVIRNTRRILTFGATYQPKVSLNNKKIEQIQLASGDSIYYNTYRNRITLPQRIGAGLFYQTPKFGVGFDYSRQDWSGAFALDPENGITLKATQDLNFGIRYTPDATDPRRMLRRWTYRAGVRYSDMYMKVDGRNISDKAISFGLGIPMRTDSPSQLHLGVEFGQRGKTGTTPHGKPLVKENYIRVSLGINLFDNNWFMKYKYD